MGEVSRTWKECFFVFMWIVLYLMELDVVNGDCIHAGVIHRNQFVWHPDICTVCRCHDPVSVCEQIYCKNLKCDYSRGERLELLPTHCCPVCSHARAPCDFKGQSLQHNTEWATSACTTCYCDDGKIYCSNVTCPDYACRPGEVKQQLPGLCCTRCVPSGRHCVDDTGLRRPDGDEWSPLSCVKCVCRNGNIRCMPQSCPELQCAEDPEIVQEEGECCPRCSHAACLQGGQTHKERELWKQDACTTCTCHLGKVVCSSQECDINLTCNQSHVQDVRNGECCPRCVSSAGVCLDDQRNTHYHGDMWKSGLCEYCTCSHGHIKCRTVRCAMASCTEGQVFTSLQDRCCSVCMPPKTCVHEGQTYQNDQSWDPDDCSVCTCLHGEMDCYHKTCSVCPVGTARVRSGTSSEDCCGRCEKRPLALKGYHGQLYSELYKDNFEVQSEGKLTLLTNMPLLSSVGKVTQLTSDVLNVSTGDRPENVVFHIINGPLLGHFTTKEKNEITHKFTLQDLWAGNILYNHHGNSTSTVDLARLQVSDKLSGIIILLVVKVQSQWPRVPVVVTNTGGHVIKGDILKITTDLLESTVQDREQSRMKEVIYRLVPVTDNPKHGKILMMVPTPLEGRGIGWTDMGDGMMGARIVRFQQQDIDEGRIYYKHSDHNLLPDRFTFEVADTSNPPSILRDQAFDITVIDDSKETFFDSALKLKITVMENQIVSLTPAHLAFNGSDRSSGNLLYSITTLLREDEGTIEHVDFPFSPVQQFTQADINNRRIIYRPPDEDIGTEEREVSFMFKVKNGSENRKLAEHKFTIRIIPVNNNPPFFINHNPDVTLTEGGTYPFTSSFLEVIDPDNKLEDLEVIVEKTPTNGVIEKLGNGLKVAVKKGDKFTYSDMMSSTFHYIHSSGVIPLQDQVSISVNDGPHKTENTIYFNIIKMDKSAPTILPSASCQINVTEGMTKQITKEIIAYSDTDDADSDVRIILAADTTHGSFNVMGRSEAVKIGIGGSFSQEDVNEGRVSFSADKEIGFRPVGQLVYMNVTDSSGNLLPNQIVSVFIMPVDNLSTVVVIGHNLKVEEGGEAALNLELISVLDVDTPQKQVIFTVETPPAFGILQNRKQVMGSEKTKWQEAVVSFPVTDLADGYIYYVQSDHKNKEPVQDVFLFSVSDGNNKSPVIMFNISIQLVNDETPKIVTEQLFVGEGQAATLTNASVYVVDLDTSAKFLIFTVINAPLNGQLLKKEHVYYPIDNAFEMKEKSTFSYEDVLNELVVYKHDDRETTQDSVTLYLTDGEFGDTNTLRIIIGLVSDETPRVSINRGHRVRAGSTTMISSFDLQASDLDSEVSQIMYTVMMDPPAGHLQFNNGQMTYILSVSTAAKTFKQSDIDKGYIFYTHNVGEKTGNMLFKFKLADPEGNELIDQDFFITVLEDHLPPLVVRNNKFLVSEGKREKLTTDFLSFMDADTEPLSLIYTILEGPDLGHLELLEQPGVPIMTFAQTDLAANTVTYVHTSASELTVDQFIFSVSDGRNEIVQSFFINIKPVDDAIPVLSNNGLRVQEGVRKLITEFDLKAVDQDTKEHLVMFTVTKHPVHGRLDMFISGSYKTAETFTMEDIYENRVSYQHDGSETSQDSFTFIVGDGTNKMFIMQQDEPAPRPLNIPQKFEITVLPVDDGMPIIKRNIGLQYLESTGIETGNVITSKELTVMDEDTPPSDIDYIITVLPTFGILEHINKPGEQTTSFTQKDINNGQIRYKLTKHSATLQDSFEFDVMDKKPNIVAGNRFHMMWSEISLGQSFFNVTETQRVLQVPVIRRGNLKQYSIVKCETSPGTATAKANVNRPGIQDFVPASVQIQFDQWQERRTCNVIINDDSVYEGPETIFVEISSPLYAVLGNIWKSTITVHDEEDKPKLQFLSDLIHVNESDDHVMATVVRSGDVSGSVSVICSTKSLTATGSSLTGLESGSDFISRGLSSAYRVIFPPGVSEANCTVKLIDDSMYESMEQFELQLSDPSIPASLGVLTTMLVTISGPNDVSLVYLAQDHFAFPENSETVELEIVRVGSDLSHSSTVWCATRMSSTVSALPGQDYIPSSVKLTFGPGQSSQTCNLVVLDDALEPRLEGNETFVVFLSSAIGSILEQPYSAVVTVYDDHLDIPQMQFSQDSYTIDEKNRTLNATIIRSGDITLESSVICYTQQQVAHVMTDFDERTFTNDSRIVFKPGEMSKSCVVNIVDDEEFEHNEVFQLKLGAPLGNNGVTATLGHLNTAIVIITNHEDAPTIQFEQLAYSVHEPSVAEQIEMITVKVIRTGSVSQTSRVRCSTRDGSALSGSDYNPKSLVLLFEPGQSEIEFSMDVLYNSAVEWHESFSVQLGPEEPTNSIFGSIIVTTITILDSEVSGSKVLPALPVVVSLLHYDDIEQSQKVNPSPGYPIVCVTPCDIQYPTYSLTASLCEDSGINQTSMLYHWEIAMPPSAEGVIPLFVRIMDKTLFTSVNKKVLDSIYFRPFFQVRCVAQPFHENGNPGIPLKSPPVTIGHKNPICKSTSFSPSHHFIYQAQSFLANLEYIPPDRLEHPNTVHISVQIPHQDGMLPLISTHPLHNLHFLLSESVYQQQHICSNIMTAKDRAPFLDQGFLGDLSNKEENDGADETPYGPGFDFPYQFDKGLRGKMSVLIYKHLNLKSCIWKFDAWYHMTELIDLCGGQIVSDFHVKDRSDTHLTISVPLFVSYVYATAPTGWRSLEHRTEMEFSFYYSTVLWKTGVETDGGHEGRLQVVRIQIGDDGRLILEFRTQARFRGQFVLKHQTLPDMESRIIARTPLATNFELNLVWSQNTFDSPHQVWKATSHYSLKDYTGVYLVELVPCLASATMSFSQSDPIPCVAQQPQRFEVPISFQQTNHPVPVIYSLNTDFQLSNSLKMFLLDPATEGIENEDWNFNGVFSRGQKLYGRVLWNPKQDLKSAYKLIIQTVYLCTGSNGYIPVYDPTGETYGQGAQFGCIQPSKNLRHRFLILDIENSDVTNLHFDQVLFNAQFAHENQLYSDIVHMPGVDGFVLDIDPLYKVDSGYQWYLQVVYTIGLTDSSIYRIKRSSVSSVSSLTTYSRHFSSRHFIPLPSAELSSWRSKRNIRQKQNTGKTGSRSQNTVDGKVHHIDPDMYNNSIASFADEKQKNGTNMIHLHLIYDKAVINGSSPSLLISAIAVPLVIIIIISVIIIFVCVRKRRRKQKELAAGRASVTRNNILRAVVKPQNHEHRFSDSTNSVYRTSKVGICTPDQRNSVSSITKSNIIKIKDVNIISQKGKNVEHGTEV